MRSLAILALMIVGCARRADALELVEVTRGDLVIGADVAGELAAADSTDVLPPTLPELTVFKIAWLAPEGSEVAAGARIVELDRDDLERKLETLRTQAAEATTRLEQTRQTEALARRQGELGLIERDAAARKAALHADVPPDLVSAVKLRGDQLAAEQAAADLAQARRAADLAHAESEARIRSATESRTHALREIDQAEHSLAALILASPRAGTVVYPSSGGGDKRKVGDSVYVSETVLQVVRLDAMVGNGQIDEVDLAGIAIGEPVAMRVDALPDLALRGSVVSIAASVQVSTSDPSNVVRLTIAIRPVRDAALRPGMRFRGQIETARVANVTLVPADAVFLTADGPVAYRETTNGVERVGLELGRRSREAIEVRGGLAPGDRVSRVDPERGAP